MLAWIAMLALAPTQEPPRLYTQLPNGAVILVERMPQAESLSTSLWISARGTAETRKTHGQRHLLEHLMAARPGLDAELETQGALLRAQTNREAMQFEVSGGRNSLELALKALDRVMQPLKTTEAQIADEVKVLDQELALTQGPVLFSQMGWQGVYGDDGLDPLGTIETMSATKPSSLESLQRQMLVGPNVVMVIAGDVDLDKATGAARKILGGLPKADPIPLLDRTSIPLRDLPAAYTSGLARAVPVASVLEPSTLATLAAVLAAASESPSGFVSYTPSVRPGLVVFGQNDGDTLAAKVGTPAQASKLFDRGRSLLLRWIERNNSTPIGVTSFRGLLLVQSPKATPERLREIAVLLTFDDFQAAWNRLDAPTTLRLRGESR